MEASLAPGSDRVSRLLVPLFGCGAAIGFLLWIIFSGPAELQQVQVGLRRYIFFLPAGFAVAGAGGALLWFIGAWGVAERLSYLSCIFYLGFLKVLGWVFVPWILIILLPVGFLRARGSPVESRRSLLLLHVMGTIAGLYMAFHLGDFLQPWELFTETVRSLWLLAIELITG